MPASYEIDAQRRLVLSRGWGVLTDEDLIDHYERLRADPDLDPTYAQLIDLREVERFATAGVTIELVARLRVFAPGARRAVIASEDVAYGMARMFASFAESQDQQIEVFRDARAAVDWVSW
jgi:hypothetical protein